MGYLNFVGTGNEFAGIPEAAGGFHGHYVYGTGDEAHNPTYHIVHSVECHIKGLFKKLGKRTGKNEKRETRDEKGHYIILSGGGGAVNRFVCHFSSLDCPQRLPTKKTGSSLSGKKAVSAVHPRAL